MSGQEINPFEETKQAAPIPQAATKEAAFVQSPDQGTVSNPVFYEAQGLSTADGQSVPYNPAYGAPGQGHNEPHRYEGTDSHQSARIHPADSPSVEAHQATQDDVPPARELQTSKFWRFEFYQQFFDVDTRDVLRRMSNSFVPMSPPDFLLHRNWHANANQQGTPVDTIGVETGGGIERNPDLYGPFWLCTTLWIVIAIVGNIMSKISHSHQLQNKVEGVTQYWSYDFQVASIAAMTIYSYWAVMSLLVMGLMKWKNLPVTLVDTLALYGYSMSLWVLAAVLCVAPISGMQWLVCIVAGLWSSAYLLANMWHVWKSRLEKGWFIGLVLLVFIFHMLITLSFKFYFLNYDLS